MEAYRKKAIQEMRPYVPGEDLKGILVSPEETPGLGGMIAVSSTNPLDKWYIPKEFFNENYEKVKTSGMTFGEALHELKAGRRVARKGWNGKNMFLYLVKGTTVPVNLLRGNCARAIAEKCNSLPSAEQDIGGHIDMIAVDGSVVVGWLASQTDMLAEDWEDVG